MICVFFFSIFFLLLLTCFYSTTLLKAFFDESAIFPNAKTPSADGQTLVPFSDIPLTIGGELNKIATNVAYGRNHAGGTIPKREKEREKKKKVFF
jgi:hypothetical protein